MRSKSIVRVLALGLTVVTLGGNSAMAAQECPVVDEPSLTKTYECLRLHQQTLNEILGVLKSMQGNAPASAPQVSTPAKTGTIPLQAASADALSHFQNVACLGNRTQCRDQAVADVLTYCRRKGFKRGDASGLSISHRRGFGLSYSAAGVGCQ